MPHSNKSKWKKIHFDTIKIFVLIISGKISGMFSGQVPIFNQLSDAILEKENYFSVNNE